MIRIIGGKHRGRMLETPPGEATRPTANRARESLFNILVHARWREDEDGGTSPLIEARVLDAYAGSGALGLESWSRGAASVTWVEKDAKAFAVLKGNVDLLTGGAAEARCVRGESERFLAAEAGTFDLVLADPPYDQTRDGALLQKTLRALSARPMVRGGGVLVFEQGIAGAVAEYPGWRLVRNRTYGGTRVLIYVRDHAEHSDLSRDV